MRRGKLRQLTAILLVLLTSVGALGSTAGAAEPMAAPSDLTASVTEAKARAGAVAPASQAQAVSARVMVEFAQGATQEQRNAAVSAVGGYIDQEIASLGLFRVAVPADGSDGYGAPAVAAALMEQPGVLSAEPDQVVRLEFAPDDEHYVRDPYVSLGQWGIRKALVDKAWDEVRASSSITVAAIDSGVDPGHPDLQGALLPGKSFLSAPREGCSGTATRDDNSHGTHVAGIIAARANNGIGIAGVAFGAKVLPLKVLDCEGHGLLSDVAQAIAEAIDSGAKIINISLGSDSDSRTLKNAIDFASSKDVLVIAAAGNCGALPLDSRCDAQHQRSYPAAYPSVLAVAATEPDDTRSSFSTQADYVDIAAPGRRIVSTVPTYGTTVGVLRYAAFSGTSQASPFIAGVAALIWSKEPTLSAIQVRARLISTVKDLGATGRDDSFGAGRVDALAAVTAVTPKPPPVTQHVYGATYNVANVPLSAVAGKTLTGSIRVTNKSSFVWRAAGLESVTLYAAWAETTPPGYLVGSSSIKLPADVAVGGAVTLPLNLPVPAQVGSLRLRFDLMQSGLGFSQRGVPVAEVIVAVGVKALATRPAVAATYVVTAPPAVLPGGRLLVPVTVKNNGSTTWSAAGSTPVRLAAHVYDVAGNVISWDGARTLLPADVAPDGTLTASVILDAPLRPGPYVVRVDLVREGIAWFSSEGVPMGQTVVAVIDDLRAALPTGPLNVSRASPVVLISVINTSSVVWTTGGAVSVSLSSHWLDGFGHVIVWDGPRAPLPRALAPGESAVVSVPLGAIPAGGAQVVIDVVADGLRWGGAGTARPVTLVP